jgi:outer membrane protease
MAKVGVMVYDLGFRVQGVGYTAKVGFMVYDSGFRVQGLGFRV